MCTHNIYSERYTANTNLGMVHYTPFLANYVLYVITQEIKYVLQVNHSILHMYVVLYCYMTYVLILLFTCRYRILCTVHAVRVLYIHKVRVRYITTILITAFETVTVLLFVKTVYYLSGKVFYVYSIVMCMLRGIHVGA